MELVEGVRGDSVEDAMIATNIETKRITEPLTKEIVPTLINASGLCITVLLPPYRPGEPGKPAAALLKMDLQEAEKHLARRRVAEGLIAEMLEPLYQLSHEKESLAGAGRWRAVFRSDGIFRQFELLVSPPPGRACIVGDCFFIRPVLASLAVPAHIYVLNVTKKDVGLLACGFDEVANVELPKGTPQTLDEAMGFDRSDHDLMNRSPSGPSTGSMHSVLFGTGSEREIQHSHLHDFYRAIDRGMNELLRSTQAPLILAGVDEDAAIYRSINTYGNLVEDGIHGSPGGAMSHAQILRRAHDIALFSYQRRTALEMAVARERFSPVRFSVDLDAILRAAAEGRVSDLYLDESVQRMGAFEGKVFGGLTNWNDEELLNVAAVETLLRGGAVRSLPTHLMPRGAAAAATLRY
jgi:hypothetical protein